MNLRKKAILALSLMCTSLLSTSCISTSDLSSYYNDKRQEENKYTSTTDVYKQETEGEEYQEPVQQNGNEYDYVNYEITILDDYYKYENERLDNVYYVGDDISEDELYVYTFIMSMLDAFWSQDYSIADEDKVGYDYFRPILVVYKDEINISRDGNTSTVNGSFYTSGIIFIDANDMATYIVDSVAPAYYIMAHEYGHHIQNLLGDLDMVRQRQTKMVGKRDYVGANRLNIRKELQADYYAGRFCDFLDDLGYEYDTEIVSVDDIVEIIETSNNIGDDVLLDENYSAEISDHGTGDQRKRWFMNGYKDDDYKRKNIFELRDEQL